jgi:hypothetical protein
MRSRTMTAGLLTAVSILAPATALAKDSDIKRRGTCSAHSTSKIKLSADNGRIETEFEVDQNRAGVRWKVTFRRNGSLIASTRATTRNPSGSFEVRRRIAGASGDTITAKATRDGETCTARAVFA